jgi:tRNA 2-thiouridine synthesizing protein A
MTTQTMDARGLKCPLPVLKARKAMKSLQPGDILIVLTTDPGAPGDFRHFCEATGHRLIDIKDESDGHRIEIECRKN